MPRPGCGFGNPETLYAMPKNKDEGVVVPLQSSHRPCSAYRWSSRSIPLPLFPQIQSRLALCLAVGIAAVIGFFAPRSPQQRGK